MADSNKRDPNGDRQKIEDKFTDESEKYVTELDYISTWDTLHTAASDSFMHGIEIEFEQGAYETGENYPRGV
jgi:hypothetical protein